MNRSMLMVAMFADCYIGKSAKGAKYSRKVRSPSLRSDGVSTFVIDFVPYVIDENLRACEGGQPIDRQEFTKDGVIAGLAKKCKAAIYFCDIVKNYRGGTLDDSFYPEVWIPMYGSKLESWEYLHDSHQYDKDARKTLYKTSTGFEYYEPYDREEIKQLVSSLTSSVTFFFQDEFSQAQLDELSEFLGVKIEFGPSALTLASLGVL